MNRLALMNEQDLKSMLWLVLAHQVTYCEVLAGSARLHITTGKLYQLCLCVPDTRQEVSDTNNKCVINGTDRKLLLNPIFPKL